jgi:hypothetical protein
VDERRRPGAKASSRSSSRSTPMPLMIMASWACGWVWNGVELPVDALTAATPPARADVRWSSAETYRSESI